MSDPLPLHDFDPACDCPACRDFDFMMQADYDRRCLDLTEDQ
jgi:hypothetical protein